MKKGEREHVKKGTRPEVAEQLEVIQRESKKAKRHNRILALVGIAADPAADVAEHHDAYLFAEPASVQDVERVRVRGRH